MLCVCCILKITLDINSVSNKQLASIDYSMDIQGESGLIQAFLTILFVKHAEEFA